MSHTHLARSAPCLAFMTCTVLFVSSEVGDAQTLPDADPLAPFATFIGGEWYLDGSHQELDWGVGRRSVKARGYFVVDGIPKLVSEGIWFWHPGERSIKGYFTAIDMPPVFFEYTTRFDGNAMVSDIRTYNAAGEEQRYNETWQPVDDQHFVWTLHEVTSEGLKQAAGGTYTRR